MSGEVNVTGAASAIDGVAAGVAVAGEAAAGAASAATNAAPRRTMQAVLAGFGGQGILFAGKIIANAALIENREVSWLPSYGPEMRGGTANCSVCIADESIGSPLVLAPDVLLVMNQPSLDKFEHSVQPGGLVVVDSTLVPRIPDIPGVRVCAVPATQMAEEAGIKVLANVILVGKLFAETHFCAEDTIRAAVEAVVPPRKRDKLPSNLHALELGMQA